MILKASGRKNFAVMNTHQARQLIIQSSPAACVSLNGLTSDVFTTRGGRIGSGMGGVIEALWGFYMNKAFKLQGENTIEMAWIYGHEYNDFACVDASVDWDPSTKAGEFLRVEVKSMIAAADESKAHFDRLVKELDESDMLAIFLWDWCPIAPGARSVYPKVIDHFVGLAKPIALLRDELHELRGGTFVQNSKCPDGCGAKCKHIGEPLNANGIRERKSGPEKTRGKQVSYAANFGGILRMLGSRGAEGKAAIKRHCASSADSLAFVSFMARNFGRVAKHLSA